MQQAVANTGYQVGNSEREAERWRLPLPRGEQSHKQTNCFSQPTLPSPLWLTLVEILRNLRQPTGNSGVWHPLIHHILPQEGGPEIDKTWSRGVTQFTQGIQAIFQHLAEFQKA